MSQKLAALYFSTTERTDDRFQFRLNSKPTNWQDFERKDSLALMTGCDESRDRKRGDSQMHRTGRLCCVLPDWLANGVGSGAGARPETHSRVGPFGKNTMGLNGTTRVPIRICQRSGCRLPVPQSSSTGTWNEPHALSLSLCFDFVEPDQFRAPLGAVPPCDTIRALPHRHRMGYPPLVPVPRKLERTRRPS
jgi:hypothetical protein